MKIRTLIVEDDPMVLSINQKFLNRIDHFQLISVAQNGEEALKLIKLKPVDLLILDVYMPLQNGLELLKQIRAEGHKVDVILVTAANSPEMIEEAMRLGVVDCILKPFDYQRFRSALEFYKKRFNMFRTNEMINQQKFDSIQLITDQEMGPEQEKLTLPKGVDLVTLNMIRRTLQKANAPLSLQQICEHVQLSRITIRKYLEYLAEKNEISLDLRYSNKGRPTKLYCYGPKFSS